MVWTAECFNTAIETPHRKIIIGTDLPSAISGKRLLGTPLENAREGKVGSISDLVFGSDSRLGGWALCRDLFSYYLLSL